MRASRVKKAKPLEIGSLRLPQKGFIGCFVLGQLLLFRGKELAGQDKGDPGAARLWNMVLEGCPQSGRTFATRI